MLDLKVTTETHEKIRRLLESRNRLAKDFEHLQRTYAQRWVAIADGKVIAHGSTADEVRTQLEGAHPPREALIIYVPSGEISRPV